VTRCSLERPYDDIEVLEGFAHRTRIRITSVASEPLLGFSVAIEVTTSSRHPR